MRAPVLAAMLELAGPTDPGSASTRPTIPVVDALRVDAGATCLVRERLAAHLVMWLERDRIDAGLSVEVVGDPDDPYAATFVIARDAVRASPRSLGRIPDDCQALHAAVALAVAVAVDASVWDAALRATPPTVAAPPTAAGAVPEAPPEPPALAPARDEPRASPRDRTGALARIGGSLAVGLTDGAAYGGNLGAILRLRRRIDLELAGTALVGPHGALAGGRVRAVLGHVDARVCGRLEPRTAVLRACIATGVGAMQVSGRTYAEARTTTVPWVALGPSFDVAIPRTGRVAFAAMLELWVPVVRTNMVALGEGGAPAAAKGLPPLGAVLSIGPIVRLR